MWRIAVRDDGDRDRPYYGRARIYAAGALIAVVSLLALFDAVSDAYTLEPVELGLFLGTAALLLGVEGVRRIMGP